MKRLLRSPKLAFRFRIRTLIFATTVLGLTFAHAAQMKQGYDREQSALDQMAGMSINRPVKHKHLQKFIPRWKVSSKLAVTRPVKLTLANAAPFQAF